MQKLIRLTVGFILLMVVFVMSCGGKAVPPTKAEEESRAKKVGRIFEMRTYYCNDSKLDELRARFRNHTNKLFAKHRRPLRRQRLLSRRANWNDATPRYLNDSLQGNVTTSE